MTSGTTPQAEHTPGRLSLTSPDVWRLLLASFLSLYVELLLIRWIPGTIHIVAFFSNLVLIACFLGLRIGMARPIAVPQAVWRTIFRLALTTFLFTAVNVINPLMRVSTGGDYGINEETAVNLPIHI